jgi:mycothiol synthase
MRVHVRPFQGTDDYAAIAALNNANFPEFDQFADEWRVQDEQRPAHCRAARWVAEAGDGRIVGYAEYDQHVTTYHPRRFNLELVVDPACLGHGIGRQLWRVLVEAVRAYEPLAVDMWTREDMPCRVAFLEHRGFVPDMRIWSSELDLERFDPAPFAAAVEAATAQGFRLRSLAELWGHDPDFERKMYELWCEVHDDVPIPPGQEQQHRTFEDWRQRNLLNNPTLFPEGYFVALDGETYAGTTQLWRAPDAGRLRTGLTGVRRSFRRRGLALALKVHALAFARARGFRSVCTENASTNAGMLAINTRLGFVRRPAWVHYAAAWAALGGT